MSWSYKIFQSMDTFKLQIVKFNKATEQVCYFKDGEEVVEKHTRFTTMKTWLEVEEEELSPLIQAISEFKGVRLDGADSAELGATIKHLADMRALVFKEVKAIIN